MLNETVEHTKDTTVPMPSTIVTAATDIDAKIEELRNWFRNNPKLPNEVDHILLKRFYQCMYYDMNETKKLIEINYELRNKHPEVFLERDPTSEQSKATFALCDMISLPGLTADNYKVSCYRLIDYDYKKVNHAEDTKAFFMFTDCRFCMLDIEGTDTLSAGEVQIFDLSGYSMKHLTKLKINILRIYMRFLQTAFPVHLKAIHIINCPSYLDRMVSVVKPFIQKDVFKMIHFHTESVESLYEFVPRHMLPEEYGGTAGKMADFKAEVINNLLVKRDYLMDANYWKTNYVQNS